MPQQRWDTMAAVLTEQEEKATQLFLSHLNLIREQNGVTPVSWGMAVRFLMARKFDVKRALELYRNHAELRVREHLLNLDPSRTPLSKELGCGKFTILPKRDQSGASLALFTARYHQPSQSSSSAVLQAVVFQLDHALSSPETQRNGLTCIYDMTGSGLQNFDLQLSKKLLSILREGYPARLKAVYVVTPPLWFKTMYKILTPFLKDKIRERVTLVSAERLCRYVPATSLPKELGGTQEVNHHSWLSSCVEQSTDTNRNSRELSNEFSNDTKALEANRRAVELYSSHTLPPSTQINHIDERTSSSGSLEDSVREDSIKDPRGSTESLDSKDKRTDDMKVNGNSLDNGQGDFDGIPKRTNRDQSTKADFDTPNGGLPSNGDAVQSSSAQMIEEFSDEPEDPPPKPPRERTCRPAETNQENIPDQALWSEESVHQPDANGFDMENLVEYVLNQRQSGIYQEYFAIRAEPPTGSFNASRHKHNVPKNRYADVLCYDHSRVPLPNQNGDPFSDYINANYVDGYKQKNAFIAAQGPLPKTYADFWRLIWHEDILTIVMTTKTMERGRQKCGQYWPAEKGNHKVYGFIKVTNLEVVKRRDYTVTTLFVENEQTNDCRQVIHLQFTSWPDFGTPSSAAAMLEFRKEVRIFQEQAVQGMSSSWTGHPNGPPILIHCSAGIGRTGTFCTLDINLSRLEDIGTVDICNTVRKMRTQRAFSIQTPDQYEFCYLAIIEYAQTVGILDVIDLSGYEDIDSDS